MHVIDHCWVVAPYHQGSFTLEIKDSTSDPFCLFPNLFCRISGSCKVPLARARMAVAYACLTAWKIKIYLHICEALPRHNHVMHLNCPHLEGGSGNWESWWVDDGVLCTCTVNATLSFSLTQPRSGNIYWATTDNDVSQFDLFILSAVGFINPQGQTTSISCPLCPLSLYCDLSHSESYERTILAFTTASRTTSSAAGAVCYYACPTLRAHNEMKKIFWILRGHTDVGACSFRPFKLPFLGTMNLTVCYI